jgi:glycosyltransferase involved in cell wall biosynthesis
VGSDAVTFAPVADVAAWRDTILQLLDERDARPGEWAQRKVRGLARAADFSWSHYADDVADLYYSVAAGTAHRVAPST